MFGKASPVIIEPWAVLPSALRMHEVDFVSSLFPGYYKAKLELNRGYGDIIDEMSVSFWVLPGFGGWLMIIGVILLFGWVVFKSIRISRNKLSK